MSALSSLFIAALIASGAFADTQPASLKPPIWSVVDFGAIGDGRTLDTAAISKAIMACSDAGGGTVLVPTGRYLTGAIELQAHVHLEIGAGATLLASQRPLTIRSWKIRGSLALTGYRRCSTRMTPRM